MSSTHRQATVFDGTGTGAGVAFNPFAHAGAVIRYQVVLASTGTVGWEHTIDGTNWVSIRASSLAATDGSTATSATASGIYEIDGSASYAVRPNVSANGSGCTIVGSMVKRGDA